MGDFNSLEHQLYVVDNVGDSSRPANQSSVILGRGKRVNLWRRMTAPLPGARASQLKILLRQAVLTTAGRLVLELLDTLTQRTQSLTQDAYHSGSGATYTDVISVAQEPLELSLRA